MAESPVALRQELGLRDLVLFNIAALVSIRWIGVAAHVGSGALLLWLLGAVFFLTPLAFVVAHLSRRFPQEGGLYIWTKEAFGEWHGFTCAWFYYVNNLFWIPGVLVSMVGMITLSFNAKLAALAENPLYVLPAALVLLIWITAANYVGLKFAKWVDNFGAIGAYLIWIVLVVCAITAFVTKGSATKFHFLPSFDLDKLNFWSQLAMAMTGLELSPILSGEIRDPRRAIFRATWISAALVVLFYICATGAILVFVPPAQVSPITGLAQAGQASAAALGWAWVPLSIALCIMLSVGGQLGTYVGACARLPFVLGVESLLPPAFARLHHEFGTPYVSILFLAIGSGILLLLSQLGETFRGAYQIMVDMTVISLFVPFLYIFAASWKFGQRLAALSGFLVSLLAIGFSFLPIGDIKSVWLFELKLIGGCILLFVIGHLLFRRYRPTAA